MKKTTFLLVFLFTALSIQAQTSILGTWNTGQENTIVEIKEVENGMEGVILSSDKADAPVGSLIIKDLQPDGDGYVGKLFAKKKEKWMDATLTRKGEKLAITVSAGFRKKTLKWAPAS